MAYIKNNWVDREGTTRYFETVDNDGALIFTPDYTQVTELGTPVNADNMNHIEEGIAAGSFTKFDLNTTYAKDDLVTVIEEASPVIYKSLQDNNIGNALSDSAYWEKITLGGWGMPSDKWVDLTLGASGTAYVAPANGWFAVSKKAGKADAFIAIRNSTTAMIQIAHVPGAPNSCAAYMPSKKGDTVTVAYDATGATEFFRFIYAEGEV